MIEFIRDKFTGSVDVRETQQSAGGFNASSLPGDTTVVVTIDGGVLGSKSQYFLELRDETVIIPKAWNSEEVVGPSDDTGLVDLLLHEGYEIEYEAILKDRNGEPLLG